MDDSAYPSQEAKNLIDVDAFEKETLQKKPEKDVDPRKARRRLRNRRTTGSSPKGSNQKGETMPKNAKGGELKGSSEFDLLELVASRCQEAAKDEPPSVVSTNAKRWQ